MEKNKFFSEKVFQLRRHLPACSVNGKIAKTSNMPLKSIFLYFSIESCSRDYRGMIYEEEELQNNSGLCAAFLDSKKPLREKKIVLDVYILYIKL
jgi:hypothetical protein